MAEAAQNPSDSDLLEEIVAALRTVHDPEIPVNIYDLGLIYRIDRVDEHSVAIEMTLTAPGCPVAGILPGQVQAAVERVPAVDQCSVSLVWDPPWTKEKMSEEARLELGMM
jgi:FeS assembly SUF system protein